jgi:hypothetical protein
VLDERKKFYEKAKVNVDADGLNPADLANTLKDIIQEKQKKGINPPFYFLIFYLHYSFDSICFMNKGHFLLSLCANNLNFLVRYFNNLPGTPKSVMIEMQNTGISYDGQQ